MTGFGLQPAGSTGGGYGTPPTAPTLTGKPYQDPVSGEVHGGRYIDPTLRDYRLNLDNRFAGMNNVQQLVHLAIHTDLASSALRELGNDFRSLDVITANFERRVLTILTNAVQHLVRDGLIEVLGFSSFRIGPDGALLPGAVIGRFRYRDLTTNQEQESPV